MTDRFILIPADTYESLAAFAAEEGHGDVDAFIDTEMDGILTLYGWHPGWCRPVSAGQEMQTVRVSDHLWESLASFAKPADGEPALPLEVVYAAVAKLAEIRVRRSAVLLSSPTCGSRRGNPAPQGEGARRDRLRPSHDGCFGNEHDARTALQDSPWLPLSISSIARSGCHRTRTCASPHGC